MLYENEFKSIIGLYKELRKDQVLFPQRDIKSKFMINFNGKKSPIFDAIEEDKIYEEPLKQLKKKKNYILKEDDLFNQNENQYEYQFEKEQIENYKNLQETEKKKLNEFELNISKFKELKENCIILNDFLINVQYLKDFKQDHIKEITHLLKEYLIIFKMKIKNKEKFEFNLIKISYQTIKKLLSEYEILVEEFELNNNKRPLIYEKIKIEGLIVFNFEIKKEEENNLEDKNKEEINILEPDLELNLIDQTENLENKNNNDLEILDFNLPEKTEIKQEENLNLLDLVNINEEIKVEEKSNKDIFFENLANI